MPSDSNRKSKVIPTGRVSRVTGLGSVAGRIATNVVAEGAAQLLQGKRPKLSSLLLTPKNIQRLTDQLAKMRGAAMKVGQLISMDGGDILPKELADILARLRDDADPMPKEQLQSVLDEQWGPDWHDKLLYFSYAPIAAASIGQVHKVITMDGTMLAVKIQYPGISKSIDSDVNNVASLIKLTGIIPSQLDISPLLTEAKHQLHEEADYRREADMLKRYKTLIEDDDDFTCPDVAEQWSTDTVLAMTFMKSEPIDALINAPQDTKNRLMSALFRLFFKEVFDFRLIQSDPNLANFRYDPTQEKLVLLDFGATRVLPENISQCYQALLIAASSQNSAMMQEAALSIGLIDKTHSPEQIAKVTDIGMMACEAIHRDEVYNFEASNLVSRLQALGMELSFDLDFWHVPPADAVFIHRKLGGLFLLAKRLGAQVNLRQVARPWLT